MTNIPLIEKDEIRELIPHDGSMCLLDKVIEWDEKRIVCCSETHKNKDNPLRHNHRLPVTALIEYGAQAMAVHGGILAKADNNEIQAGYVASLRNVFLASVEDVSGINNSLQIEAIKQMSSGGNMIYTFTVKSDQQQLVSGQTTVIAVLNGLC